MSFLEEGLYSYLKAQTTITDLVVDRIYPIVIRQNIGERLQNMPAITYRRTATSFEDPTFTGISHVYTADVDIECWSDGYGEAKELADRIEVAMNGITEETMGSFQVGQALQRNLVDQYETEVDLYYCVGSWTFSACRLVA